MMIEITGCSPSLLAFDASVTFPVHALNVSWQELATYLGFPALLSHRLCSGGPCLGISSAYKLFLVLTLELPVVLQERFDIVAIGLRYPLSYGSNSLNGLVWRHLMLLPS